MSQRPRRMRPKSLKKHTVADQRHLLAFIQDYRLEHGFSPTIKEIAVGIDLSKSATYVRLKALKEEGYVNFQSGMSRTIVLTESGEDEDEKGKPKEE